MMPADVLHVVRHPVRLAVLRRLGLLDRPAEEAFDRLTRLAARLLRAPVALVSLVDEDRQFFLSAVGLPEPWAGRRQTPLSHSFCQHVVATGEPLTVADARAHPVLCHNLAVPELGVAAYLGLPLTTTDGTVLGSFCAIDAVPRAWHADDLAALRDLAAATMTEVELRSEVQSRRAAEADLRRAHNELDGRVRSRTADLACVNAGLRREIADRVRAEDALRLRDRAIEAITQGVCITDATRPDNPIVYVNRGFEATTGYTAAEVVGRNCRFLQGPGTDPAALAAVREAVRTGRACSVELLNYKKDGTPFWNALTVSPVRDEAGWVTHFVATQVDTTPFRALEEQARQSQKMEAVGLLAGGVAHDFNNLLTVINGYAELLLATAPAGDPKRGPLAEILRAGERSADLTRQLLAFSRKQVLAPRVLDLNAVVTEAAGLLRRVIGEDVALATAAAADLWPVKADPGQVEQVLLNLAVNARDAMPTGGRLTVDLRNVEAAGSNCGRPEVLLSVADTGCGMDAATAARAFEPFFTTKGPGKGTGLGLATVYGIVRQSGGRIEVESRVGAGTTFRIHWPATPDAAVAAPAGGGAGDPPRGAETVLVVEDEPAVRELARGVLARVGYAVLEAASAAEAVRVAAAALRPIHLLLTDVVMPGAGGRTVAERLTAARPGLKVLYMSGYADDAVIRHGVREAEVAFLPKPFAPGTLLRKVREVLDAPRVHDRLAVGMT